MAPSIHSDGLEPPSPRAQIAAYRRAERSVSMGNEHMGSEYGAVADEAPTVGTGPVTVLKNGWIKKVSVLPNPIAGNLTILTTH